MGVKHVKHRSLCLTNYICVGCMIEIFQKKNFKFLQDSPMLGPAQRYLSLRSLGAPAVLLSLATQGVFRGFKDTTTPLYATGKTPCF